MSAAPTLPTTEELKQLASDMLATAIDTVRNGNDRITDLDTAIENATDVVTRCTIAAELSFATKALKDLNAMRNELLERQVILFMSSVKPLVTLLQNQVLDPANPLPATPTSDDSDTPIQPMSLADLTDAINQLENPPTSDEPDDTDD